MSSFVVSARKYRPARFEDVVGQGHVSQTLKNALQQGRVAHAYLFCGPRGVGKTTCARILARVLNCEQRTADFEACGECNNCKSFNDNASFNISELDAASNNSVESIRALVEQVRFAPQQGQYKIYIIDEVHMLSSSAFNAFLKTLEEPPPYAIFILATTEKHKIIPTILSRCQIYDFRRITVGDMAGHLKGICDKEGLEAESEALHTVAMKADGALRDALSLFDRIRSATGGEKMTYSDVVNQLNILDYDYYFKVVDAVLAEDISKVLLVFDEVMRKGFEPDLFVSGMADHMRQLLVCQDSRTLQLVEGGDNLRDRYATQAALSPTHLLLSGLDLLNDCDIHYKSARNQRLHVEMALIRLVYAQRRLLIAPSATDNGPNQKKTDNGNSPSMHHAGNSSNADPGSGPTITATGVATAPPISDAPKPGASGAPSSGSTALDAMSAFSLPNLDLLALAEQVEIESEQASQLSQELDMAIVMTIWQEFLATSTPSTRQALEGTIVDKDDTKVVLMVPSEMARGYISGDISKLRDSILAVMRPESFNIEILVDESLAAANSYEPPKKLTFRDKYRLMSDANQHLDSFIKSMDFKPENE
jgi:DNA polymerase III subunit gamma/tau